MLSKSLSEKLLISDHDKKDLNYPKAYKSTLKDMKEDTSSVDGDSSSEDDVTIQEIKQHKGYKAMMSSVRKY